jgi:hypothetical protein
MSLSDRLKQAEQDRSPSAMPSLDPAARIAPPVTVSPVIDLTRGFEPILDLTDRSMAPIELFGMDGPTHHEPAETPCPRCGGPTHVDMFDQVQQATSLSCLACFHMFRKAV